MDVTTRTTERMAATGDADARRALAVLRQRQGLAGFEAAAAEWLAGAQVIVDARYDAPLLAEIALEHADSLCDGDETPCVLCCARLGVDVPRNACVLSFERGRRYWRVVSTRYGQRGAFGFLDVVTGAVLKTASWKGPAKHSRGSLWDEHGGLSWVGPYGIASMARGGR